MTTVNNPVKAIKSLTRKKEEKLSGTNFLVDGCTALAPFYYS